MVRKKSLPDAPRGSEYGDFQTPLDLARRICRWLKARRIRPEILVEPTFGQGHFIVAALETFPSIRNVYGVEIHRPYFLETKRKIRESKLDENRDIRLFHDDVFRFSFSDIAKRHADRFILVLGNPPWVTNSLLGALGATNVPGKSNFKNVRGIEAMTGKGNFDLGESVTISMLRSFSESKGCFAFLVKDGVVKNIVHQQCRSRFPVGRMENISIDAKKEFGAAVDAGLLFAKFRQKPALECTTFDAFDAAPKSRFGWTENKFVSDIDQFERVAFLDGISPEVWRQGIKHDCSGVMELTKSTVGYGNSSGESAKIEEDLVYPLLKSSDLKKIVVDSTRKFVLVPQTAVGQDTAYIKKEFPKTYAYLHKHRELFERRKSSIYREKPPFSIFGVGGYSFKPYKIAISGLYKQTRFSLIPPIGGKPVMLDDTCYFLGLDTSAEALCVLYLLNRPEMQELFRSLVFWKGKRIITKDILMRLDYSKLMKEISADAVHDFARKNGIRCDKKELREQWKEMRSRVGPS